MNKQWLSKIDRYIIKKFLGTFVFSIALIITISVVFDINEKIDAFLKPEVRLKDIIFDYYLNFIPYYANLFSPLFVFIAVIFFTSKLAENSEIIAMLSTGMSFKRLMKPYVISAAIIGVITFIFNSFIIPPGNLKRIDFQSKYIKNNRVEYAESIQLEIEKGVYIFINSFNTVSKTGYQFSMDKFKKSDLVSRLTAERITYDSVNHWTLYNYKIRSFRGMYEKDTTGMQIDTVINISPLDLVVSKSDAETMTTPELTSYINRQRERGTGNATQFDIERHKRYASIFSAFILTIIGASLSSRKMKGGMGFNIAIGLGLSFGYILFMTVTSTFAVSGAMPPWLAAWIPNIVFVLIAIYLYKKAPQ
ncbi:LptF/LptG family permease [Porphyromonas pogonae]|uniref:LptF/LptG family permease n=1 Tax=Porphyromonas pogonae TaxID=867595 RepID=UPI002E783519|nr:LptF/LptG family permease [Porphyromonas pogonae]